MKLQGMVRGIVFGVLSVAFGVHWLSAADEPEVPRHVATRPLDRLSEPWWKERHERFNSVSQEGEAKLVFLGDSITQGWEGAGKDVWREFYADRQATNFGNSGDRTEHVLWRLEHGNFDGLSPKLVVIMIGTNNIGHRSSTPDQAADGIRAIVQKLRAKLPDARLLLLGVFPRGEKPDDELRQKTVEINERIEKLDELDYVHYVNIGEKFLQDDGTLSKEIMPDYLHLSPEGYRRWAEAIEPHIRRLLDES